MKYVRGSKNKGAYVLNLEKYQILSLTWPKNNHIYPKNENCYRMFTKIRCHISRDLPFNMNFSWKPLANKNTLSEISWLVMALFSVTSIRIFYAPGDACMSATFYDLVTCSFSGFSFFEKIRVINIDWNSHTFSLSRIFL